MSGPRFKDKSGNRYGRLVVVKHAGTHPSLGQALWECRCDCGNHKIVLAGHLSNGNIQSCGCLAQESRTIRSRKEPGYAAQTLAYQEYKKGAKRRNIPFLLTRYQFLHIVSGACHYCGQVNSRTIFAPGNNGSFSFNGIDRLDNSKGYELGNCAPCCTQCNRAKTNLSYSDFLEWVRRVYEYAFG